MGGDTEGVASARNGFHFAPDGRLALKARVYLPQERWHAIDVDNCLKSLMEALQGAVTGSGSKLAKAPIVIPNDNQVYAATIAKARQARRRSEGTSLSAGFQGSTSRPANDPARERPSHEEFRGTTPDGIVEKGTFLVLSQAARAAHADDVPGGGRAAFVRRVLKQPPWLHEAGKRLHPVDGTRSRTKHEPCVVRLCRHGRSQPRSDRQSVG